MDGGPHAYLPSAQMMMSSPQQLPFTGSHQGCVNQPGQVGGRRQHRALTDVRAPSLTFVNLHVDSAVLVPVHVPQSAVSCE